ncbi:MAG: porin [Xanthomonadales bacterium]|nr:porin [Xanthomonadales bacterium]
MKLSPVAAMCGCLVCGTAQAAVDLGELAGTSVSMEGLLQSDGYWFDNDRADLNGSSGSDGEDTEFGIRRAEVVLKGKGSQWEWAAGYDLEAEKFLDTYVKRKLGAHSLRLGQYKQSNSYEELSSSKNNDFIAKALSTNLFAISRRLGAEYAFDQGSWGASVGLFGRELTRGRAENSGWSARGYWLPMQVEDGFLHVGLSYVDADTTDDSARFSARPGADFATVKLVDSGTVLNVDRVRTVGLESAWASGAWKWQGEWMQGALDRTSGAGRNASLSAWYASAVYNLTGETWSSKSGVVKTAAPSREDLGMWQLAARVEGADLDDAAVQGGDATHITLGVNWYWRQNFRISVNYVDVRSDRRGVSDDPSIFETRLQLHW